MPRVILQRFSTMFPPHTCVLEVRIEMLKARFSKRMECYEGAIRGRWECLLPSLCRMIDLLSMQGNMREHDTEESDALDALGSLANFAGCAPPLPAPLMLQAHILGVPHGCAIEQPDAMQSDEGTAIRWACGEPSGPGWRRNVCMCAFVGEVGKDTATASSESTD